jgi:hypothetical protein
MTGTAQLRINGCAAALAAVAMCYTVIAWIARREARLPGAARAFRGVAFRRVDRQRARGVPEAARRGGG